MEYEPLVRRRLDGILRLVLGVGEALMILRPTIARSEDIYGCDRSVVFRRAHEAIEQLEHAEKREGWRLNTVISYWKAKHH